jgi:hypothetical protein
MYTRKGKEESEKLFTATISHVNTYVPKIQTAGSIMDLAIFMNFITKKQCAMTMKGAQMICLYIQGGARKSRKRARKPAIMEIKTNMKCRKYIILSQTLS